MGRGKTNQKGKTVKWRGEVVWLGVVSGLGTPDRESLLTIPFKWEEFV
jgi:hypothetical protein